MAYALVGSAGAVSTGAAAASVTPAFGQSPTGNNLLVLWVASDGSATTIGTPAGWTSVRVTTGTSVASAVLIKVATGGDSAPTVAGITSSVLSCQLAEFSGGSISAPNVSDQIGHNSGTTSPSAMAPAATDKTTGELVIVAYGLFYSAAATKTLTLTSNNATLTTTTSAALNTADHYAFGFGVTTANAAATTGALTFTTTSITGFAGAMSTFKLLGYTPGGGILEVL